MLTPTIVVGTGRQCQILHMFWQFWTLGVILKDQETIDAAPFSPASPTAVPPPRSSPHLKTQTVQDLLDSLARLDDNAVDSLGQRIQPLAQVE